MHNAVHAVADNSHPVPGVGVPANIELNSTTQVGIRGTMREWLGIIGGAIALVGLVLAGYGAYRNIQEDQRLTRAEVVALAERQKEDVQSREKLADSLQKLALAVAKLEGAVERRQP